MVPDVWDVLHERLGPGDVEELAVEAASQTVKASALLGGRRARSVPCLPGLPVDRGARPAGGPSRPSASGGGAPIPTARPLSQTADSRAGHGYADASRSALPANRSPEARAPTASRPGHAGRTLGHRQPWPIARDLRGPDRSTSKESCDGCEVRDLARARTRFAVPDPAGGADPAQLHIRLESPGSKPVVDEMIEKLETSPRSSSPQGRAILYAIDELLGEARTVVVRWTPEAYKEAAARNGRTVVEDSPPRGHRYPRPQ